MSVKRWMLSVGCHDEEEEDARLRVCGPFFIATLCLLRGTRPTNELKVDGLG